jgi:hypothetical protein
MSPPPENYDSCNGTTTKRLRLPVVLNSSPTPRIPKAKSAHPAPPHRLRLPPNPREPQAHPEQNTPHLNRRHLRAVPPDPPAHAAAPERAPAARRVLGSEVEQQRQRR